VKQISAVVGIRTTDIATESPVP